MDIIIIYNKNLDLIKGVLHIVNVGLSESNYSLTNFHCHLMDRERAPEEKLKVLSTGANFTSRSFKYRNHKFTNNSNNYVRSDENKLYMQRINIIISVRTARDCSLIVRLSASQLQSSSIQSEEQKQHTINEDCYFSCNCNRM